MKLGRCAAGSLLSSEHPSRGRYRLGYSTHLKQEAAERLKNKQPPSAASIARRSSSNDPGHRSPCSGKDDSLSGIDRRVICQSSFGNPLAPLFLVGYTASGWLPASVIAPYLTPSPPGSHRRSSYREIIGLGNGWANPNLSSNGPRQLLGGPMLQTTRLISCSEATPSAPGLPRAANVSRIRMGDHSTRPGRKPNRCLRIHFGSHASVLANGRERTECPGFGPLRATWPQRMSQPSRGRSYKRRIPHE